MESEKEILISLTVLCSDSYLVAKVSEVLARAGTGLALEGLSISMNMTEIVADQEGVEPQ